MSKYKIGDRVVCVKWLSPTWEGIGKSGVIEKLQRDTDYYISEGLGYLKDEHIVLEEIYNSPLYKIMSEKEEND